MITAIPERGTPERKASFRSLIVIFSVATLSASIMIAWTYLGRLANGRYPTEGLSPFYWELPGAYFWILLFPFLYYIVRRNPFNAETRIPSFLAIHFCFALLFSAFHIVVNTLISGLLFDAAGSSFYATNPWCPWTSSLRMSWRILFYSVMTATCYALHFHYGATTKNQENSNLLNTLHATRLEQLKVRIDPGFVDRTLSEVARLMQTNTAAALETITRLGSFFRLIQKQESNIPLARHVQLLRSYFHVETGRSEGQIRAKIKIEKRLLPLRIHGFFLQPFISHYYRSRASEACHNYRLVVTFRMKKDWVQLSLKDNLPRTAQQRPPVTRLKKILADNGVQTGHYRIRCDANCLQMSFDPESDPRASANDPVAHEPKTNRWKQDTSLWLGLSALALLYFFTRRALILFASGNGLEGQLPNLHIALLLCFSSVPWILWLAGKVGLQNLFSIFLHSAIAIVYALVIVTSEVLLKAPDNFQLSWTHIFVNPGRVITLPDQILVYWGIVLVTNAFWNHRKFRAEQVRSMQLQSDLSSAKLKALEMQLHPHFLFNTLHTINGLILTNKLAAAMMLRRLQQFLQMTLASSEQHLVPFTQELQFLKCYIDIQKIRFGNRLNIKMDIDPATLTLAVPQLILQPIVENAIRYGLAQSPPGGEIILKARRQNDTLLIAVQDNGPGLKVCESDLPSRKGIGLQNSALRLHHLYGTSQNFSFGNRLEGGFEVRMEIPLTA